MTNLQTNTSLTASHNLNPFEVVLIWTTKNKYSLPHFQHFVTKKEKFNSSQDAELWLGTTLCTEAAMGNFQDRSSSSFRREVKSWQTLSWTYFNWWGKGENAYFKYFWINVLKNAIEACSKQSLTWQTPAMPQGLINRPEGKGLQRQTQIHPGDPGLTQPVPPLSCSPNSSSAKPLSQHHLQSPASLEKNPSASSQDNWGFPASMRTQKLRP